jgi:hypothetical protein
MASSAFLILVCGVCVVALMIDGEHDGHDSSVMSLSNAYREVLRTAVLHVYYQYAHVARPRAKHTDSD